MPPLINQSGVVDAPDSQLLHGCRAVSIIYPKLAFLDTLFSSITVDVIFNVIRVVDAADPNRPTADTAAMF